MMTARKRRPGESFMDYRHNLKCEAAEQRWDKIIAMRAAEDVQTEGTTVGMWRCACESYKFKLYEDGLVQCAECDKVSPQMICGLKERDGG